MGSRRTAVRVTRDLPEQLDPFRADAELEQGKSGRVAFRPRQVGDEAGTDRIGDLHEHHRHGASGRQQRPHDRGTHGQDDVRRERGQFRRVAGIAPASPAIIDLQVASDLPP
jgi:hypothetical protein